MNLYTSVNNVLKRLDDYPSLSGEQVWTRDEVELYLKDGYNAFCRQTKCLLDFFYPENVALAGNYVAKWERTYFDSGMIAVGLLGFSGGYWERDYALASATGPANLTQPWEAEYLTTTFPAALHPIPEDNVTVDRATHDFHGLDPEFTRYFEERARDFQTTAGEPWRFTMDRDGIGGFRLIPAGSGNATVPSIAVPGMALKAYWTLDEASGDRVDSVGTAHLSPVNAPGSDTGKIDSAATFDDGSSQQLTHSSNVDLDGADGITVACWLNIRTGAPAAATWFFNGTTYLGNVQFHSAGAGNTHCFFGVRNDAGETQVAGADLGALDTWFFVVGKYDPDTLKCSFSVDGGAWTETPNDALTLGHPIVTNGEVYVGGVTGAFSKAYIDEIGVWNKVLTAAEIAELYALTRPDFTSNGDGQFGLLRDAADTDGLGTWAPSGTWGVLREIPEHFPMGAQFGVPRRLYSDNANTRVEYFRLGKSPSENAFELPERFMRYAEFWAQAKCLERDGPGQDLKLAGHFVERFSSGVRRMVKRLGENKRAVSGKIGSPGRIPTKPALARLPWRYGRQIRHGY